ncbi:MAG: SWIM zinc finger family protein [Acidimicrobiaceae bacterium]|nr:SWIM zinc finger family protein [Acidimicrobiaceae bacterium]
MDAASELREALDERLIEGLAGTAAFLRGVAYLRDSRVESATLRGDRLTAKVRGTLPYEVELWFDDSGLNWACSCPAAEDGSFCKHCVAVALSQMQTDDASDSPGSNTSETIALRRRNTTAADPEAKMLAEHVGSLEPGRLTSIVLEQCERDWRLRERLLTEAKTAHGEGPDLREWRKRVRSAFGTGGFVSYYEAADWAHGVHGMLDAVDDLGHAGHHDTVAELAEYAHRRADRAINHMDDSDGWLTAISDRLAEMHLQACTAARPDPVKFAKRLAKLELTSELDGFHRSAATYAEVLGDKGLAAFRRAIEPEWSKLDPAGDEWADGAFGLRQAMIGWALGSGDPEALIEAHRRERIRPHDMAEIAAAFERAGRDDDAIEWARRGLSGLGHGSWQAAEARDLLARKLRQRGQDGAAVDLYWKAFEASPSLGAYRQLRDEDSSADWLGRCRQHLLRRLGIEDSSLTPTSVAGALPGAAASVSSSPVPSLPADVMSDTAPAAPAAAAILTELLLYEGQVDEAWEAALTLGTSPPAWMTLARQREATSPADSITIYESQALAIINRKKPKQYKVAVELMDRIRLLAPATGEPHRFDAFLRRVRAEHKPKRRLMTEIDKMGWQLDAA